MQTGSDKSGGSPARPPVSTGGPEALSDTLLRKLLIVDDEADGAEFAAILLRSSGLEVVVAQSASEALQVLLDDHGIDALLTDVMMRDMTGLQLADAVRAQYPAIKIVLMSGFVLPELLKDRESDYLFVKKPYRIDELLKVLRS